MDVNSESTRGKGSVSIVLDETYVQIIITYMVVMFVLGSTRTTR